MIQTTVDGRYQVIARVASGGMGEVYRAHDSVLDREVALKVLHTSLASDPGFIDRFRREARAAAMLGNQNIVAVHDWGSTDGTYFMVMEFIRGHSLRALLTRYRRLEPAQVAEVAIQVLAALDHAHTRGIVHRDIKPENILVTPDGSVKVADFGLARALAESVITHAPGTVTGTVQYLAPEQVQGDPADPRTDLYSLGVVMWELLTGKVPFTGETSLAIAYRHMSEDVPAPSKVNALIPPVLDDIVVQATRRKREERPASASIMRRDLVAAMRQLPAAPSLGELAAALPSDEPVPDDRAMTVTIARSLSPKARRRRAVRRAFSLVALVLAVVAGAWGVWTYVIPHKTTVPRVTGLTLDAARARLEGAGLDLKVGQPQHSPAVPVGQIISQSVKPGAVTRKHTDVLVVLSLGPDFRKVPKVIGLTRDEAEKLLKRQKFKIGDVTKRFDDVVAIGQVLEQNPRPGTSLEVGKSVDLILSKGPAPIQIPDVRNLAEGDAESLIVGAGFIVSVREEYSGTVAKGLVVHQDPLGNTEAHRGDTVTIFISKGPKSFAMPGVTGMSESDARAKLEGLGLLVRTIQVPASFGSSVVGQDPPEGTTVQQGDEVTIYLA